VRRSRKSAWRGIPAIRVMPPVPEPFRLWASLETLFSRKLLPRLPGSRRNVSSQAHILLFCDNVSGMPNSVLLLDAVTSACSGERKPANRVKVSDASEPPVANSVQLFDVGTFANERQQPPVRRFQ
jgi:hypothetical protein